MYKVKLTTERLRLRQLEIKDFDAYSKMCADPEVMKYISDGKPKTPEDTWLSLAMLIGHWSLLGYGMWAVENRSTGTFMGRIGFLNPLGWPGLEIGWLLGKEFRNRGFATEAATAALEWGYKELGRNEFISLIYPNNIPSKKVAEKIGSRFKEIIEFRGQTVEIYQNKR